MATKNTISTKAILISLWSFGLVPSYAVDPHEFPPFDKSDLAFGLKDVEESLREETSFPEKSTSKLRAIMAFAKYPERHRAAKILVQTGDREAILRIVYGLKQGNPWAEEVLKSSPSREVVPFLMEDVAHGSMENFGDNWPSSTYGIIRFAATEIVASTLCSVEDFSEPTKEWLRYVRFGNGDGDVYDLSQKSKFLVEWWILNEQAFLAGRWNDVLPLPNAGSYPPRAKLEHTLADDEWLPPPIIAPSVPWTFKPLDVPESFEDWSARIVHPERRDLRWVKLTFESGTWVEHPPIQLDPLSPQAAPSRSIRRPMPPNAAMEHDALSQWPLWIVSLALVVGLLLWIFRLRKTRSV